MGDYSISGNFGEVAIFCTSIPSGFFCSVDHINGAGWHKVNELYRIVRPKGTNTGLLLMTLSGHGRVRVGKQDRVVSQGEIAIIPKEVPNAYNGIRGETWEFFWIHYSGSCAEASTEDIVKNGAYVFSVGLPKLRHLFQSLTEQTATGMERELEESDLLRRILFELLKKAYVYPGEGREKTVIDQIIAEFEQDKTSDFCLERLAERYHYSREHIIRLFKHTTGMTPYRYWQGVRFKQACAALEDPCKSISQIAADCGYRNISSFSKQFKLFFRLTPSQYRRLYGFCRS